MYICIPVYVPCGLRPCVPGLLGNLTLTCTMQLRFFLGGLRPHTPNKSAWRPPDPNPAAGKSCLHLLIFDRKTKFL